MNLFAGLEGDKSFSGLNESSRTILWDKFHNISFLSVLQKVMGRIVFEQIQIYFDINNLNWLSTRL